MNDKERAISAYIVSHKNDTPNDALRIGKAFNDGAKWANRTMIEKAIKWIEENIDLVAMDTVSAKSGYHQIEMMQDFEQKFREAMQE